MCAESASITAHRSRVAGVHEIGFVVPVPHEKRQPTSMIDVRVREHDGIDLLDRDGKPEILLVTLAPLALKHAAVQQYRLSVRPAGCDTSR